MLPGAPPLRRRGVHLSTLRSRVCLLAILAAAALMLVSAPAQASGPFPITETFTHTSVGAAWHLGGSAQLTAPGTDTDGNGWLRMTNTTAQAGYAYYDTAFPSTQ